MKMLNCLVCLKKNIGQNEIERTTAGGHGREYLYWHKKNFCQKNGVSHLGAISGAIRESNKDLRIKQKKGK